MAIEAGSVSVVSVGATKTEGGTRAHKIEIGKKPQVAFEVWDTAPLDWPEEFDKVFAGSLKDPFSWAEKCVNEYKAKILCVKLQGAHPDFENKPPEACAKFISQLLKKVDVPLIISGCGDDAKDNLVLPLCCEAAKNERCLIGSAVQDNYKTLVAAVLADEHNIIAESPIDINIACVNLLRTHLDRFVDSAMNTKRQSIPRCIHLFDEIF